MDVLRNYSGLEPHHQSSVSYESTGQCESAGQCGSMDQSSSASRFTTFRTIPPERVGLNGEYDHCGLSKRVSLSFSQNFQPDEIENLRITQRGAVVVLLGKVSSRRSLTRMVSIALGTRGAGDVEINGISIVQSFKLGVRAALGESSSELGSLSDRPRNRASYAC